MHNCHLCYFSLSRGWGGILYTRTNQPAGFPEWQTCWCAFTRTSYNEKASMNMHSRTCLWTWKTRMHPRMHANAFVNATTDAFINASVHSQTHLCASAYTSANNVNAPAHRCASKRVCVHSQMHLWSGNEDTSVNAFTQCRRWTQTLPCIK